MRTCRCSQDRNRRRLHSVCSLLDLKVASLLIVVSRSNTFWWKSHLSWRWCHLDLAGCLGKRFQDCVPCYTSFSDMWEHASHIFWSKVWPSRWKSFMVGRSKHSTLVKKRESKWREQWFYDGSWLINFSHGSSFCWLDPFAPLCSPMAFISQGHLFSRWHLHGYLLCVRDLDTCGCPSLIYWWMIVCVSWWRWRLTVPKYNK